MLFQFTLFYSENQKTVANEDDIKVIIKCIWCCYKANSFISNLLNHFFSEVGLFTLQITLPFSSNSNIHKNQRVDNENV